MDIMDLYVVRHGESWANAQHRCLGSLDPLLTERGREQAQELRARLPLDALIVSPRLRAMETASILNEKLELPAQSMDCFRERDVGVFEGLTQADARERYSELWSQTLRVNGARAHRRRIYCRCREARQRRIDRSGAEISVESCTYYGARFCCEDDPCAG